MTLHEFPPLSSSDRVGGGHTLLFYGHTSLIYGHTLLSSLKAFINKPCYHRKVYI